MLCALTIRKLKPGTFEEFRTKFGPPGVDDGRPPEGWTAFHMLRNSSDEDEVVTFGFFEGTLDQLERNQGQQGYDDLVSEIAPLVRIGSQAAGGGKAGPITLKIIAEFRRIVEHECAPFVF